MEQAFLFANIANYLVQLMLVAGVIFAALFWGGPGPRLAGAATAIAWPATSFCGLLPLPESTAVWIICALDLLNAAALLYAAARYNSLWISLAVVAQGVQAGVDLIYVGQGSGFDRIHHFMVGVSENLFTYIILISLLGAARADRARSCARRA